MELVPLYYKENTRALFLFAHHMKIQQEGSHLQSRKGAVTSHQILLVP